LTNTDKHDGKRASTADRNADWAERRLLGILLCWLPLTSLRLDLESPHFGDGKLGKIFNWLRKECRRDAAFRPIAWARWKIEREPNDAGALLVLHLAESADDEFTLADLHQLAKQIRERSGRLQQLSNQVIIPAETSCEREEEDAGEAEEERRKGALTSTGEHGGRSSSTAAADAIAEERELIGLIATDPTWNSGRVLLKIAQAAGLRQYAGHFRGGRMHDRLFTGLVITPPRPRTLHGRGATLHGLGGRPLPRIVHGAGASLRRRGVGQRPYQNAGRQDHGTRHERAAGRGGRSADRR
jgi:hypothetical protein